MPKEYRSSLKSSDFISADVVITADKWVEIGEKVVEAGLYYAIGYGFSNSQSDADGRFYAVFKDTAAAEVTGILRIAAYTPDDMPIQILGEWPTSKLNSSATDMTKQLPLPKIAVALGLDYKFKLFFKAATVGAGTLDKDNTVIQLDVTKVSKAG